MKRIRFTYKPHLYIGYIVFLCLACIDKADSTTVDLYKDTETTDDGGNNDDSENNNSENNTLKTKTIDITQNIEGVNITRTFRLQTPTSIDTLKNYPLVFAFHGRGGNKDNWIRTLKKFTDSGEFIGVYPQGYLESWNLGSEPSKADDTEFVNKIVTELKTYSNLNFEKMYAIGTSNGSALVNQLAIETTHFKAIAPIVSQLIESQVFHDNMEPISVYQICGAEDTVIPISGGDKLGHVFLDALESAKKWANHFGCDTNSKTTIQSEDTLYTFDNCDNGIVINYLRVENGSHNIQEEIPNLYDIIWEFFQLF
ncbi:MAG: alpha/beta hydrolase family esterase [Flavicella sp.]